MKKTFIAAIALFGILGGTLLVANVTDAFGTGNGSSQMLETKAEVFGMTVEELEIAHETMDFEEIAIQQGVSIDEMHAQMEERAVSRWEEKGLSEEEIAERLTTRSEMRVAGEGPYSGGLGFGQGNKGAGSGSGSGDCTQ